MFVVVRYNSNGSVDNSFGTNGFVYTDYGANSDAISKILIQTDQKIIAIGGTGLNFDTKHEYVAVARYKTNGNLDSSFGIYGKSTLQYTNFRAYGYDGALQSDGKLVLAGSLITDSSTDYLLVRLKTAGNFDSTFGINGTTITSFGRSDIAYGVKMQSGDSSIIASGTSQSYNFDTTDVSLAAYNQSGIRQMIITKIKHWLQHNNGFIWDANNSINNYIIQRSYDDIHFNSISKITSAGNPTYTYTDPSPLTSTNYYRLQTINTNGAVNYSNVIAVTTTDNAIKISPNPATNNLRIDGLSASKTKLTVVDFSGNIKLQAIAVNTSYNLNIATLTSGNYLLKVELNDKIVSKNFVKE